MEDRTVPEIRAGIEERTAWSADRTLFAAERTYAAWVRTGLAALASGVGARALAEGAMPLWVGRLSGTVLILFATFCFGSAVWRQYNSVPPRVTSVRRMPVSVLIPVNAFLALVALAALVGVWAV